MSMIRVWIEATLPNVKRCRVVTVIEWKGMDAELEKPSEVECQVNVQNALIARLLSHSNEKIDSFWAIQTKSDHQKHQKHDWMTFK